MENNQIKNKSRKNLTVYILFLIGITLILPVYLTFPSITASLLILLDILVFAYAIGRIFKELKKVGIYYAFWYLLFPFVFIVFFWIFLLSPLLDSVNPSYYSLETSLFPIMISLSIFFTGRKMGKIDGVNRTWPRFAMFITPFTTSLLLLILYAFFTDIGKVLAISYGLLFAFLAMVATSFFYFGLDSKNEQNSILSSQIVNARSSIGTFFFIMGLFLGLYFESVPNPFSLVFLIFFIAILLIGVLIAVKSLYRSSSVKLEDTNLTTFNKFEKVSNLTSYSDISYMGKAVSTFENEGAKEQLIIAATKYLTERGMDLDFILRLLKQIMEYNPPRSVALGVANRNSRIYENEVSRRKNITENLLKYMGAVGEKNEQ